MRELRQGEVHSYVVSGGPDEWFQTVVVEVTADVAVTVIDPAGQTVIAVDGPFETGSTEEVSFIAVTSGVHRIEVRPSNPRSVGRYEIRLVERRPATSRDHRWLDAERAQARADAMSWRDADELRAALALHGSALETWRALGERRREAHALNRMAVAHQRLGERQQAMDDARAALAIAREAGSFEEEKQAATGIAVMYGEVGELRRAVEELQPLLEQARRRGSRPEECVLQHNLAVFLSQLGEVQQSLQSARAALQVCRQVGSADYAARALVALGTDWRKLGLEGRALEAYAEALAIARPHGLAFVASLALAHTGDIHTREGEPQKAVEPLKEALQFAESSGHPQAKAGALVGMGRALAELGETAQAADHLSKALEILERLGDRPGIVQALLSRGRLRLTAGQLEGARQDYERSLAESRAMINPDSEAAALQGLAQIAAASGHLEEALRRSDEAIGVTESLRARLLSRQNRAEYLARIRPYYELAVDVLMSLHAAHPDAGYDAAAFQMSERGRARSLLEGLESTAERGLDRADPEVAQKERDLREQLNGQAARLFRLQSQARSADDVAAVRKEVETLLDQLQEIHGRMGDAVPAGRSALDRELGSPEWRQRTLDGRSLLLVYALGERRSFVWAASRDSVASRELPPRAAVEAAARGFYEALTARNSHPRFESPEARRRRVAHADRELTDAGGKLSDMLLAPVATELRERRLLVVADDSLHRVPFSALPEPTAARAVRRRSGEPLLVRHEVLRVPSAAALTHWQRQASPAPGAAETLAVFADPVFERDDPRVGARIAVAAQGFDSDWRQELTRSLERSGLAADGRIPRLPHTREEALALTSLVPAGQSRVALGFEASRAAALSPELASCRFVHFATHAVADEAAPNLSSVVLSLVDREGREVDGFLRAEDAAQLHLNADLVTLSGCSTGLGRQVRGEGTMGLAHGFLRAGARRVLVSLWDVDDRATAAFMARLYRGMLGPKHLSPAEALRATQAAMRAGGRWSTPYFWAAFILVGDPSDPSAPPPLR